MKSIKKEMLEIYKPYSNLDWLNYRLIKKDVTLHHIQKKEDNGKQEVSNLALIMPIGHQYLHIIEYKDIGTYLTINKLFTIINSQQSEPTAEQREIIEYLLRSFETKHEDTTNSKGKLLIKEEYRQRFI